MTARWTPGAEEGRSCFGRGAARVPEGALRQALTLALMTSACGLETRGPVLFEAADASRPDAAACAAGPDACAGPIGLTGQAPTSIEGGDSGSAYVDLCPDEQVLIGYAGSLREISTTTEDIEVISSLEAACGQLSLDGRGALRVTPTDPLPARGEMRGAYGAFTRLCPADQVLIGVEGRAGLALDQLALVCARWQLEPGGAGLMIESEASLPEVGGSGGSELSLRCPSGQVARGHTLRAGRWIDAFGLICAEPTLEAREAGP